MTRNERDKADAKAFADKLRGWGFRVWLAERGTYGFFANAEGTRVVSFSADGPWSDLSGNYGPPSTESGTGWKMDLTLGDMRTANDVRGALNACPPRWCGKGWSRLSTVADMVALYGSSSRYEEVTA